MKKLFYLEVLIQKNLLMPQIKMSLYSDADYANYRHKLFLQDIIKIIIL